MSRVPVPPADLVLGEAQGTLKNETRTAVT